MEIAIREEPQEELNSTSPPPDVNNELQQLTSIDYRGKSVPLFATPVLWKSLLWSYPLATPRDYIRIITLEPGQSHHDTYLQQLDSDSSLRFTSFPKWLPQDFTIKYAAFHSDGMTTHVVLYLPHELPTHFIKDTPSVLPLGLIASLIRYINGLRLTCTTADATSLLAMRDAVKSIFNSHPLRKLLQTDSLDLVPICPDYMSPRKFRSLLLSDFGQILEILAALDTGPLASTLRSLYLTFFELSNELLDIVESLVALAAQCPDYLDSNSPYQRHLWCYYHTCSLVRRNVPVPPKDLLMHIQSDLSILSGRLPLSLIDRLEELQQRLSKVQRCNSSFGLNPEFDRNSRSLWN